MTNDKNIEWMAKQQEEQKRTDRLTREETIRALKQGGPKNEFLSAKLPGHMSLEEIDKAAIKHGTSRASFIVKAVEMLMGFDKVFFNKIEAYAKGLNTPVWLVMQNMIIKRMAQEAAEEEVWGPSSKLLDEFMYTNQGPITGAELFTLLMDTYSRKEESKKVEQLLREEAASPPLSDEDKAFLIKHRVGRAWLESDEYKKEREEYERGLKLMENRTPEDEVKFKAFQEKHKDKTGRTEYSKSFWESEE
ncbi:MAG: hypothetical protein M1489_06415 [Firmicutes bacterium]|nr:hypothetical protein [Bacillota bacterium]